jgi:hypothetical protein
MSANAKTRSVPYSNRSQSSRSSSGSDHLKVIMLETASEKVDQVALKLPISNIGSLLASASS